MYVPKIKQIVGGKIAGKLKDLKTGMRYTGKFVQDYKGNFFKGEKITSKSEPLEFVPDDLNTGTTNNLGLYSVVRKPTPQDYQKGYFVRYFVKDSRSGRVVEVDKRQYLEQQKQAKLYRRTLKLAWNISGPAEDTIMNNYLYPGAKSKNAEVVRIANKDLPGIGEQVLKDLGQFVK